VPARDTWAWLYIQAALTAERAAAHAATVAAFHEQLVAEEGGSLREVARSMAAMHRRVERRQLASARTFRAQADRLGKHLPGVVVPELLVVVAGALGARGAALTLLGSARYEESAIASDSTAAAAQELEFTLGEGPVHDAAESRRLVVADEATMPARWTQYSRAVTELGVRSVTAAPLCLSATCIGVLTAFDPADDTPATMVHGAARTLADTFLTATGQNGAEWSLMAVDDRRVVHQATGMIAARLRCSIGDALAVLRARAFAESEAIGVLARRVVDREVVFE
jgi:hypothetical protein